MGYGVLFTIVGDYRTAYGMTETEIGLIIGLGFLSAFVAQLLIAPIADRGRARQVVVLGVLVNVAGLLLMGFGGGTLPIVIGRLISGVGIGAAGPAIKRIVILAYPEKLGENLGRLLAADVFGFAAGPAVSALLVGTFGLASPFVVVAGATLITVALSMRVHVLETVEASTQRLAMDLIRLRPVAGGLALGAASFLMIGAFDALWDVVHEDLGTPDLLANLGITLFAVPLIILGPIGGRWAQRVGPYKISAAGLMFAAPMMASYGWLPNGSWIFGIAMFHAIGDGLTISAAGVAVSMAVPGDRQAAAQGLLGGSQALSAGITAPIIGWTYQNYGRAEAYLTASVGMVLMTMVGMGLAYDTWRHHRFRGASIPSQQATSAGSGA
jgi:MFS family permease